MCTQKEGEQMSPRTGRPKSDDPKNIQLKIRADKKTIEDLDYCCQKTKSTRSDIVRKGIQRVKKDLDKE